MKEAEFQLITLVIIAILVIGCIWLITEVYDNYKTMNKMEDIALSYYDNLLDTYEKLYEDCKELIWDYEFAKEYINLPMDDDAYYYYRGDMEEDFHNVRQ